MNKSHINELNFSEARGWVIDSLNHIELSIIEITKEYLQAPKEKERFLTDIVLNSSIISFWWKINILAQICKNTGFDQQFLEDLRKMGRIRNAFAHSILKGEIHITMDLITQETTKAEHHDTLEVMQGDWTIKSIRHNDSLNNFVKLKENVEKSLEKLRKSLLWS
jgi:hypothetical protein